MGLGKHLGDEGVVVEFLDLPDFSLHIEVLVASLIDVRKEVLIFEVHSIIFSIIVSVWVVGGRFRHVMVQVGVIHVLQVLYNAVDGIY